MEMKIDSLLIKKLREDRSWSQEHLAEVSGLSGRTVQRVETEGKASPETRMALAAAFGVDVAALRLGGDSVAATVAETAPRPESRQGSLLRHAAIFLLVCAALVFFDVSRHGAVTWSKWPVLGWGIGLMIHGLRRRSAAAGEESRA